MLHSGAHLGLTLEYVILQNLLVGYVLRCADQIDQLSENLVLVLGLQVADNKIFADPSLEDFHIHLLLGGVGCLLLGLGNHSPLLLVVLLCVHEAQEHLVHGCPEELLVAHLCGYVDCPAMLIDGECHPVHPGVIDTFITVDGEYEESVLPQVLEKHIGNQVCNLLGLEIPVAGGGGRALELLPCTPLFALENKAQGRRCNHCGDKGHHDDNAEKLLVQYSCGDTDTCYDKGNLATGHHATTYAEGAVDIEAHVERGPAATDELAHYTCDCVDQAEQKDMRIKELDHIHHHTHDTEEERHQECGDSLKPVVDDGCYVGT